LKFAQLPELDPELELPVELVAPLEVLPLVVVPVDVLPLVVPLDVLPLVVVPVPPMPPEVVPLAVDVVVPFPVPVPVVLPPVPPLVVPLLPPQEAPRATRASQADVPRACRSSIKTMLARTRNAREDLPTELACCHAAPRYTPNMKATALAILVLPLAGCGGNVVVDGLSSGLRGAQGASGGGASTGIGGTGAASTTTSVATTGSAVTTTTTGPIGTTGSGGCVSTCSAAVQTGATPCLGLPFADYGALGQCACPACGQSCADSLCKFKSASPECLACVPQVCPAEFAACFGM
jgi:hypothetical protein